MRPILLKMKGLNSFIEEQAIDFARLMEPGLFGIFGPTGSGKTTILDGITLALYGEIARKSKNFVNTNCKSASVFFEFQISGAEIKKYRVEREFKQDPVKEGYKTGKCRLSDITGETPVILADKVTDVNKYCMEIIGLKSDDFQRTVVLPQGRFSEFLKLEGKKRSEMLERLFRLQPYGDGLIRKVKEKREEITQKKSNLNGQLSAYVDITEEKVEEKKEELAKLEKEQEQKSLEVKKIEAEFQEGKIIWDLQEEQKKHWKKKEELAEQEETMKKVFDEIELSKKASSVIPFLQACEKTSKESEKRKTDLMRLEEEQAQSEQKKRKTEQVFAVWRKANEEELPKIREKAQRLKEAIEYQKEYWQAVEKKRACEIRQKENEKQCLDLKEQAEEHEEKIVKNSADIEKLKKKQKEFEVSFEVRQQVQDGVSLEQQVNLQKERLKEEEKKYTKLAKELERQMKQLSEYRKILFGKKEWEVNAYQNYLYGVKEKSRQYTEIAFELKEKGKLLEKNQDTLEQVCNRKNAYEEELLLLTEKKEKMETALLAFQLRKNLEQGQPCPVCGSIHHEIQHFTVMDVSELESIRESYGKKQSQLRELEKKQIALEGDLARYQKEVQELLEKQKELEQDVKGITPEEIAEKIRVLSEYQAVNGSLNVWKENVKSQKAAYLELKTAQDIQVAEWKEKRKAISYSSFAEASQKLKRCDEWSEKIRISLEEGIAITERLKAEQEKIKREQNELEKESANLMGNYKILTEQEENWKRKFEDVSNQLELCKIEDRTLQNQLSELLNREKEIQTEYRNSEENRDLEAKRFSQLREEYLSVKSSFQMLKNQLQQEEKQVSRLLQKEAFASKESCMEAQLSESELERKQKALEMYQNACVQNEGFRKKLEEQLAGRMISEEEWNGLFLKRKEESDAWEAVKLLCSNERQNYQRMLVQWETQKELQGKMKKIEHQESLLADLEQLFRGKKFVEFVAYSKLRHISKAASHRLKEISNGNYGLVIDDNGRFLICDYKNGGVKRDAFTLSGGETFLVSLALSLALSEQVQLKGTAPLELFFLDEGFGTLDEELLEVVMSSLERIQNKHLTVGIISHVEAVKNRVPIKLNVFPSVAGMGGTKVKIEKN